jgi:hypothetical protein
MKKRKTTNLLNTLLDFGTHIFGTSAMGSPLLSTFHEIGMKLFEFRIV